MPPGDEVRLLLSSLMQMGTALLRPSVVSKDRSGVDRWVNSVACEELLVIIAERPSRDGQRCSRLNLQQHKRSRSKTDPGTVRSAAGNGRITPWGNVPRSIRQR